MATSYQTIIDAIDAAVLTQTAVGELTAAGRVIKWRSLDELMRARKTYAALLASSRPAGGISLTRIKKVRTTV